MKTAIICLLLITGNVMAAPIAFSQGPGAGSRQDTIILMPNWPISKEGKNERGGIFCNLDQDSDLEIVYTIGNYVHAFNYTGSEVPGWPVELNYPTDGVAAFGDIDGDGFGEIVVTTHQPSSYNDGKIYALRRNGSGVAGFPVTTEGGPLRSPVLADLDDDGDMEIIVAVRDWPEGFIHVYDGDGTMFDGWPQRMDYIPAAEVAVGDITGDDVPEIIAESYYSLHAYSTGGTLLSGFPFTPGNDRVFSYSSPVLADVDDDGLREILFGDHSTTAGDGNLYIMNSDGTLLENWPQATGSGIYCPPAVGDINGDGSPDVVVGEYGFNFNIYKLYAWECMTGEFLEGFPVLGLNSVNNQVIMADIDGDGEIEMMFDDNTSEGIYLGYNHDGTPMDGWPLHVVGTTFYINPFVADLNGDGIMEISGGGYDPEQDRTYLYLWETEVEMVAELALLPVFQYNTRHNGVSGDYLMVGEPESPHFPGRQIHAIASPNPANDYIFLSVQGFSPGHISIEVIDPSSRIICQKSEEINAGQEVIRIDLPALPDGMVLIKIVQGENVYTEKVLIRRPH